MGRIDSWSRAGAVALAVSAWAGGCGRTFETGAVLQDGASARVTVLGPAEVTLTNQGSAALGLTVGWGEAGTTEDDLVPGVARWWSTDGPRWFRVVNRAGRPVAVSCRVKGSDAAMETTAR